MKRQISSLVIASAVLAGSAFAPVALDQASAKTVQHQKQQQQKVEKVTFVVNGKAKVVNVTSINKKKLYSVDSLSKLMSATLKYNKKTKTYEVTKKVDKKAVKIQYKAKSKNTVLVGKTLFVDIEPLVKALGGDLVPQQKGYFLSTKGLVSGDTSAPQWVNKSTILVQNDTESDSRSLLLDTTSKSEVSAINTTDVVVSPNGKQAIYADENGYVHLVDLATKKVKDLNVTDDSIKSELVWSNDGQKVYFFTGDKTDKVASINVADGVITPITGDSLTYKQDLQLSADGKKLLYIVSKEGVTTTVPDGDTTTVDNIDTTGTEPQIYQINLTDATPTAVKVTTATDNKVEPGFLSNGNIVYVSAEPDSDQLPTLNMIDENNTVTTLVSNKDIVSSFVTAKGKVFILVAESNKTSVIYEVNPDTKKLTKKAQTKLTLDAFSVSNDGTSIAATTLTKNGEVVVVYQNGNFESLTK